MFFKAAIQMHKNPQHIRGSSARDQIDHKMHVQLAIENFIAGLADGRCFRNDKTWKETDLYAGYGKIAHSTRSMHAAVGDNRYIFTPPKSLFRYG